MAKFSQGVYVPRYPEKYIGKNTPKFRSSWELAAMRFFDEHPNVMQWASESIIIPYICPFTKKRANYIPDFFMIYNDKNGIAHAEIIEIKPFKETGLKKTKSRRDALVAVKNNAKWMAAKAFCSKNGLEFRVITENELFVTGKKI